MIAWTGAERTVGKGFSMKYNKKAIMTNAWVLFRKGGVTFAEALHRAWNVAKAMPVNAERIAEAAKAAGVTEEFKTWAEWKKAGFEVRHGSKRLFMVELIWASKGDGKTYKASFFGASQVDAIADGEPA